LPAWTNTGVAIEGSAAAINATDGEAWWTGLHDPAIDTLVAAALADNPTLVEAAARVDQARAAVTIGRAQGTPQVGLDASAQRARTVGAGAQPGATSTINQNSAAVGPSLSWEIDLWGRARKTTKAARSRLQARDADAADARLSIAAQVADSVLMLRASDLLLRVRDADIASRENELAIFRTRVRLGSIAPADAATAESNLANVRIDRISQEQVSRQTVDALVALSGRPAAEVRSIVAAPVAAENIASIPPAYASGDLAALMPIAPVIVPGLPATVLLAHPGVVAAEREVAARWSEIGVARAERLPRLDLTAILTGQWIRALGSSASFITGSVGAGLSGPLIDGGSGRAEVVRAEASYQEAVATLNVTLRQAVRDIEDGLAAQDSAVRRIETARTAVSAARLTLRGSEARRRAGSIGAFELEDSRRQLNRAQESAIGAARDRAQAWVELIRRSGSILDATTASGSMVSVSLSARTAGQLQ
jgi:NodT family efflux transporter outer membrane factor (OMF) lipoprotein